MRFLSDIRSASYSAAALRAGVRPEDPRNHRLSGVDLDELAANLSSELHSNHFSLSALNCIQKGGKNIFSTVNYPDLLALRRTNNILIKCLRHTPANRDYEIKAIKQCLSSEPTASVFRCDVKSFFESIDFESIIGRLIAQGLRGSCCIKHLQNTNKLLKEGYDYSGLPRGLALSSTLADFLLYDFDLKISNAGGVALYSRYVDDILIIHFGEGAAIESLVNKSLSDFGLSLNADKTQHSDAKLRKPVNYLGYRIEFPVPIRISISSTKIEKIKKRIILSILLFIKDGDFASLVLRLEFLMLSTRIKKYGREKPLYTGISHTYKYTTEKEKADDLRELDGFYFGILKSHRYHLGRRLNSRLTATQKAYLNKMSFFISSERKIVTSRTPDQIKQIRKAWSHVT